MIDQPPIVVPTAPGETERAAPGRMRLGVSGIYALGLCTGYVLGAIAGFDAKVIAGGVGLAVVYHIINRRLGTRAALWLTWLLLVSLVAFSSGAIGPVIDRATLTIAAVTLPGLIAYEISRAAAARKDAHVPAAPAFVPEEAAPGFDPWQGRTPSAPFMRKADQTSGQGG